MRIAGYHRISQEIIDEGGTFTMKKLTVIMLAGIMSAALLAGCSNSKKKEQKPAQASTESASTEVKVDYSKGLNEDGTLAGINAADYVTVCEYKNLEIPEDKVAVSKEEIQQQIDSLLASHVTENQVTDREVKKGDTVNIDYEGTIDGTAFEGGTAKGQNLTIGSGTFIDGFEDQLIGKKPGDEVEVNVTFPKDYGKADLAGKPAVFKVKINYISESVTPELTDEFVKENYESTFGFKTVKEMKSEIKSQLQNSKYTEYLWDYLVKKSKFKEIPEKVVNPFVDVYVDSMKSQITMYGYDFKEYLKSMNIESEEALRKQYYSTAEDTVKVHLIADVIAKEEGITVTDDDIKELLKVENIDDYVKQYSKAYLSRYALNNLVIQKIRETAKEVKK